MTDLNIRSLIPMYASEDPPKHEKPRMTETDWFRAFKTGGGLWLIILFAWAASLMLGCCITGLIVRKNTKASVTQEVTEQVKGVVRQGFEDYQNNQSEETDAVKFLKDAGFKEYLQWQMGANIKTGDASKQEAINAMVPLIADHIAGLRMDRGVTIDGARTYIWGVDFSRLDSGRYGDLQHVLEGNIEGYTKDRGARPEDTALAQELCTDYIYKALPSKWSPDLEFAEINADGSVTARNEWKTGSMTKFWRYGE